MHQDIRNILEAAILAPSGENSQPWKFKIKGLAIQLHNVSERDTSLYNWSQRGSDVANGAAIENIIIASMQYGYLPTVNLFPDSQNRNFVAEILLTKSHTEKDDLYSYIPKRITNRKAYKDLELKKEEIDQLKKSVDEIGYGKLLLSQDKSDKSMLSVAGSVNEKIMFNNPYLHDFFFSHINWNKKEDMEKKVGFFIDTLELPPPAKVAFRIFKHWSVMKILNKIGINKAISKQNAKTYASAAAIGIIVAEGNEPKDFVMTGRVMQRMWLKATKFGLSIQPLTGGLFFMLQVLADQTNKFTDEQVKDIREAYRVIENIFNLKNQTVPFMFRIGRSDAPSARSSRYTLDVVTEIENA
ncbi:nitroreductase [Candidatus Parcubacteria bacterium]|nr:nitroreductase [Candidatus Parcubacteria bacterium]